MVNASARVALSTRLTREGVVDVPPDDPGTIGGSITVVVFSKDRPMQLDACLASMSRFAPYDPARITVVHRATTPSFAAGYELVQSRHPVRFLSDRDGFRTRTLEALSHDDPLVVFHTDDEVFFRPVTRLPAWSDRFACFSLRLGGNTGYCYPLDRRQEVPLGASRGDLMAWDWRRADGDFAYPMSLNGHVFERALIVPLVASCEFRNPNELEEEMHARRHRLPPFVLAFSESAAVALPVNVVSETHSNRAGTAVGLSPEDLNRRYLAGERIALELMDFGGVRSAHAEVGLVFGSWSTGA